MNNTRLFVLGMLARGGPMHGHRIRRAAQTDRTELWADVKPGSLYAALHRLEAEGVVEAIRTEQVGKRPARTVYAITREGRVELAAHRDEALGNALLRPDPVDLALQFAHELGEAALRAMLEDRRRSLAAQVASWQRLRTAAAPYLTALEKLTFRHTQLRLETEVGWHDELLAQLPTLLAAQTESQEERP